jgi:hypothetical protein
MDAPPTVGTWYEDDEGDRFVVVAIHADRGTLEIGTLDGSVEEMDLEEWTGMTLQEIEPPEEWHGSMDDFLAGPGEESE